MGLFVRKSVKVGPLRFNVSKRGLGVSAGVKGLRVGIDSRGKTYIAGGRGGIYFRQNIGQARRQISEFPPILFDRHDITTGINEEIKKEIFPKREINAGFWVGLVVCAILAPAQIYFLIPAIGILITVIWQSIKNKTRERSSLQLLDKVNDCIQAREFKAIEKLIQEYAEKWNHDPDIVEYVIILSYTSLIPEIVDDMIIDEEEEHLVNFLTRKYSKNDLEKLTTIFLDKYIEEITSDKIIDDIEKKFIEDFIRVFSISDENAVKYRELVNYYEKIDRLREGQIDKVTPSIQKIDEFDKCYQETAYTMYNPKSMSVRDKGKLFLTANTMQFVGNGHTKIDLKKLLTVEMTGGFSSHIEVLLQNRKTPIVFDTEDNLGTLTILQYLIRQRQ
jgi:hypothetical protein